MIKAISYLLGLCLLSFLVACGQRESLEDFSRSGILKIGVGTEPEGLDPHLTTSTSAIIVESALFEGLVSPHPKTLDPEPGMAERWEVLNEGKTYRFHLRDNLKWSDGKSIDAYQIEKSWQRFLSPTLAAPYAGSYYMIKGAEAFNKGSITDFSEVGIQAVSEQVIEFELTHAVPYFLNVLLHPSASTIPVHLFEDNQLGDRSYQWIQEGKSFIGSGPFILKSIKPSQRIEVVANPFYWDASTVRLNEIQFWFFDDPSVEERAFMSEQIHGTNSLPQTRISYYKKQNHPALRIDPYLGVYYLLLNQQNPLLADSNFRAALSLAIDRQSLVRNLLGGGETVAESFVPPALPNYDPPKSIRFDPILAKAALQKVDLPGEPIELEYLFNTSENHRRIAEAIQSMWQEYLGIDIRLVNQEWRVYLDRRQEGDFEIARAVWVGDYIEPTTFLDLWKSNSPNNWVNWSNENYDSLMEEASLEEDLERRNQLYQESEKILLRENVVLPIYHYTTAYLMRPEIEGWESNLLDWHPFKYVWIRVNGH